MSADDQPALLKHRRKYLTKKDGYYTYQFLIVPNHGFLNTKKPLPPKIELKLTFERANAENSLIKIADDTSFIGSKLKLKNVYLQASYISSPYLRSYFSRIEQGPIKYKFEDCSVLCRNISAGQQVIRMENIYGGKTNSLKIKSLFEFR